MARTTLTSRIETDIKIDLQLLAKAKNTTPSELNERVLRMYIKQQKLEGVIK